MRIAVKYNYHFEGIRTSFGSRSYFNTYGPQPETAECVQRLMELGAIVTGKTKMTSFMVWEEQVESVDYQAPWNSRADGFRSPGGSSSGSAAALAAYDWLDITLGTDSEFSPCGQTQGGRSNKNLATGGVLRLALWCGLFALRPAPYLGISISQRH